MGFLALIGSYLGWSQSCPPHGEWVFLAVDSSATPVQWRWRRTPLNKDQISPHDTDDPPNDIRRVYGIHAALFHTGWVLLWGSGEPPVVGSEPFSYTPCLLWHHTATSYTPGGGGHDPVNGYVRYLADPNPSSVGWQANLFCAGSCFTPDGSLAVFGGHNEDAQAIHGLRTAYIFDPSRFIWNQPPDKDRYDPVLHPNGYLGPQDGWRWVGMPTDPDSPALMADPRWYPTPVAHPDGGTAFIVGGLRINSHGGAPDTLSETSEWFLPNYDFCSTIPDPPVAAYDVFDIDWRGDQFPLGRGYPYVHLVSWGAFPDEETRIVYTGVNQRVYEINPYSFGLGWSRRTDLERWDPNVPGYWACPNGDQVDTREGGTSVLLPNPILVPSNEEEQALSRVMVLRGSACYTLLPPPNQTEGNLDEGHPDEIIDFAQNTRCRLTWDSCINKARQHANAVILPNGQIFLMGGHNHYSTGESDPVDAAEIVLSTELFDPDEAFAGGNSCANSS